MVVIMTLAFIGGVVLATMVGMWILDQIDSIPDEPENRRERRQPPQS